MPALRAPWARWYPIHGKPGGTTTGHAKKITLHTTEGYGLPNWHAIGNVPHFTVNPATGEAWQHLDLDRSGYALASPGAPRSPNMNAGLHVQFEVIGRAALTPTYPDRWYKMLAVWLSWVCNEWGIPKAFPLPFGGDEGYGQDGDYRVPWTRYREVSGIIGHSNAPYNSHWDPGDLDQVRLLRYMTEGENIVAITDEDIKRIADAIVGPTSVEAARRVNQALGDFNAAGKPNDGVENPELGAAKIRRTLNNTEKIKAALDPQEVPGK